MSLDLVWPGEFNTDLATQLDTALAKIKELEDAIEWVRLQRRGIDKLVNLIAKRPPYEGKILAQQYIAELERT